MIAKRTTFLILTFTLYVSSTSLLFGEEIQVPVRTIEDFKKAAKKLGEKPSTAEILRIFGKPLSETSNPFGWVPESFTHHSWIYVNKNTVDTYEKASVLFHEPSKGQLIFKSAGTIDTKDVKALVAKQPVTKLKGEVKIINMQLEGIIDGYIKFDHPDMIEYRPGCTTHLHIIKQMTPPSLYHILDLKVGDEIEVTFHGTPSSLLMINFSGMDRFKVVDIKLIKKAE